MPRVNDTTTARAGAPDERGRLSRFLLKPAPPAAAPAPARSVEELKDHYLYADDKERLIGLALAPVAAAIAVMLVGWQVGHDPAAHLSNGSPNPAHAAVTVYYELLGVLAALSVAMLATAWFRKRLFLGMVTALYGLAVFNLHWWGFGIPFAMVGAWYLVRAYRAGRALKDAGITPREVTRRSVREEEAAGYVPAAQPFSKQFARPVSPRRRTSAVGR